MLPQAKTSDSKWLPLFIAVTAATTAASTFQSVAYAIPPSEPAKEVSAETPASPASPAMDSAVATEPGATPGPEATPESEGTLEPTPRKAPPSAPTPSESTWSEVTREVSLFQLTGGKVERSGVVTPGMRLKVLNRSASGKWTRVELENGSIGSVISAFLRPIDTDGDRSETSSTPFQEEPSVHFGLKAMLGYTDLVGLGFGLGVEVIQVEPQQMGFDVYADTLIFSFNVAKPLQSELGARVWVPVSNLHFGFGPNIIFRKLLKYSNLATAVNAGAGLHLGYFKESLFFSGGVRVDLASSLQPLGLLEVGLLF